MNHEILTDFFNHPHDTTRNNTIYVNLWCKDRINKFVEKYMDETNYKTFAEWFKTTGDKVSTFHIDNWITNDELVYQTIRRDLREMSEMSNNNVRIFAKFCRMNFFVNYVLANKKPTNLYDLFYDIYDIDIVKTRYLNKSAKR